MSSGPKVNGFVYVCLKEGRMVDDRTVYKTYYEQKHVHDYIKL